MNCAITQGDTLGLEGVALSGRRALRCYSLRPYRLKCLALPENGVICLALIYIAQSLAATEHGQKTHGYHREHGLVFSRIFYFSNLSFVL